MGKRLRTQRRGKGFGHYLAPSHMRFTDARYPRIRQGVGIVEDIVKERGRIAPLALVNFGSQRAYMLAPEGIKVNREIRIGPDAPIEAGNCLPIGKIPEGTLVYNIEITPGDGGKLVRTAGQSATIVSHGEYTVVVLPSGRFKEIHPDCQATVGIVAGGGHIEKPWGKAGKKFHAYKSKSGAYFHVSGIAMNPVDHPHGGGSHPHVGTQSSVSRHTPPGRKVGRLAPKRKKRRVS
ncbi:MAG: 50S ribosomal protein L2 [Thermoplasmata archaeon]